MGNFRQHFHTPRNDLKTTKLNLKLNTIMTLFYCNIPSVCYQKIAIAMRTNPSKLIHHKKAYTCTTGHCGVEL